MSNSFNVETLPIETRSIPNASKNSALAALLFLLGAPHHYGALNSRQARQRQGSWLTPPFAVFSLLKALGLTLLDLLLTRRP